MTDTRASLGKSSGSNSSLFGKAMSASGMPPKVPRDDGHARKFGKEARVQFLTFWESNVGVRNAFESAQR